MKKSCAWAMPVDTGVMMPIDLPDGFGKRDLPEDADIYGDAMWNLPELERQGREIICRFSREWPLCSAGGTVNLTCI